MNTRDFETNDDCPGDEPAPSGSTSEVVLSDRVNNAVTKGADHPFQFAMGCDTDTTAGGVYIQTNSDV